jgi:hypothetical protein
MAKIKLENDNVIIYYSEVGGGLYDTVKNFKVDLTNKKHYSIKTTEDVEIEWGFGKEDELLMIENLKKETWFLIENCYNVIHSYKNSGDQVQVEKHEKFLKKNKTILDFLNNYKL